MKSAESRIPFRSRPPGRRVPPSAHAGEAGDIDVWRVGLDEAEFSTLARWQAVMSADEADRARRFHFERDRRRYVVARGILRTLLAGYLARAPQELQFEYGTNGKPRLAAKQAGDPALHFNLAHAGDLALYAFTRADELGIDLEQIRPMPDWDRIAAATFAPPELARLHAAPPGQRNDEFFAAWVRQEARLKARGVGLGDVRERRPEDALSGARGESEDLIRETAGPAIALGAGEADFAVPVFRPAPGFIAALAARPAERWITCLTWVAGEEPFSRRGRRVRLDGLSNVQELFS